jgi:energy-converting hydrogenase Eha subunit A
MILIIILIIIKIIIFIIQIIIFLILTILIIIKITIFLRQIIIFLILIILIIIKIKIFIIQTIILSHALGLPCVGYRPARLGLQPGTRFGPSAQGMTALSPCVYNLGREGLEEGRDGMKKSGSSQSLDSFSL